MNHLGNISLKKLIELIKTEIKTNSGGSADRVTYDNTTSGLVGSNIQEAIDELAGGVLPEDIVFCGEEDSEASTVPLNADTVGGYLPEHFAAAETANSLADEVSGIKETTDAIVDYIVEQGTSGIWTYRKWNSGIAECWGVENVASLSIGTSYNSVYYTVVSSPVLPFIIVDNSSVCSVSIYAQGLDFATAIRLLDNKINYYWVNPVTYTVTSGVVQYRITGRWK